MPDRTLDLLILGLAAACAVLAVGLLYRERVGARAAELLVPLPPLVSDPPLD